MNLFSLIDEKQSSSEQIARQSPTERSTISHLPEKLCGIGTLAHDTGLPRFQRAVPSTSLDKSSDI